MSQGGFICISKYFFKGRAFKTHKVIDQSNNLHTFAFKFAQGKIFIYPKFCIEQPNQIFALSFLFALSTLQILGKFYTEIFYFELVFQSQSCDNDSLLFSQKCIGSIAHFFSTNRIIKSMLGTWECMHIESENKN